MIGTLIICLPSVHEGGDVHLSHAGKSRVFATSQHSAFDVTALAWYSDVTHEIKEVTSGYRLVLTYNLIQDQTAGVPTSAKFFIDQQTQLQKMVEKWRQDFPKTKRLLYVLEHEYSKIGLSAKNLKGRDRPLVKSLQDSCSEHGYYLFLAKITKSVTHDEDGNEVNEDEDESTGIRLDTVVSCDGTNISSFIYIVEEEILGTSPYGGGRSADSEDEGEFTGNASQPTEHRYHNSVSSLQYPSRIDSHQARPADSKS